MITDDQNKIENTEMVKSWLETMKSIDSKFYDFSNWFDLSEQNLILKYDTFLIIESKYLDSYTDDGVSLQGTPLYTLISMKNSDDLNSDKIRLDIKIPYELYTLYKNKIEDISKYGLFFIEAESNLFRNNLICQSADNAYLANKELFDGKFNALRQSNYEDLPLLLSDIMENNGVKGFPMLIYELMVMALSRDLNNPTIEFRHLSKNKNPFDSFQMINIRDISRNTSSFSALSSENISKSLLVALGQSKKDDKEQNIITPQEQIALGKF